MAEEKQGSAGLDLGSLLGGILSGGGNAAEAEAGGGGISADALSDGIGKVLSDPQMMAKLPDMIEMLRPMMGSMASGGSPLGDAVAAGVSQEREEEKKEKGGTQALSVPASGSHKGGRGAHERRIALLCALRPYLNPRRQEAIDYILRMDKMGKLFRNG